MRRDLQGFRRKDGSDGDGTNFHDSKRSNETHESTTDPDARLYKKSYGKESKLLCDAYAWISVPSTAKNCCATALVSSRSRFFENTAWFHTASSMPRPTNQRNSRL